MNETLTVGIMCCAYTAMIAMILGLYLHDRAIWRLQREHQTEIDGLRGKFDAERDSSQSTPRILAASSANAYCEAYNRVGVAVTLNSLQEEKEAILRRLDHLERIVKSKAA